MSKSKFAWAGWKKVEPTTWIINGRAEESAPTWRSSLGALEMSIVKHGEMDFRWEIHQKGNDPLGYEINGQSISPRIAAREVIGIVTDIIRREKAAILATYASFCGSSPVKGIDAK